VSGEGPRYTPRCEWVKRLVFFVDGVEFPPEAVETYIRAHEDAVVPPTVAAVHPDIIDRLDADVEPWVCEACTTQYAYSAVEADTAGERLVCPECADRGALVELHAGGGEPAD